MCRYSAILCLTFILKGKFDVLVLVPIFNIVFFKCTQEVLICHRGISYVRIVKNK